MANKNDKTPGNVPGPFYVDSTCIDCDLCRNTAPATFLRNDEIGLTVAGRQPTTPGEILLAQTAAADCPTDSIGTDG
ncbi:MAG TPA: ferredoxin [Verrucomicrobiae bacterium]|nr:ferredoxin [Verrucomicrobiae bacterium]